MILSISKGHSLRNTLSCNYVIQYCLDRKALKKAVYVDARKDHLRAIDYVDGKEILEECEKLSLISFLQKVALYLSDWLSECDSVEE